MFVCMCAGTGKSITGAHLAYAFALKNRINPVVSDVKLPTGVPGEVYLVRKPVMYCGPSNKAVDRVLGKQLKFNNIQSYVPFLTFTIHFLLSLYIVL